MPRENDLEGQQDLGGKHGGHAGMPKPEDRCSLSRALRETKKGRSNQPINREFSTPAGRAGTTILAKRADTIAGAPGGRACAHRPCKRFSAALSGTEQTLPRFPGLIIAFQAPQNICASPGGPADLRPIRVYWRLKTTQPL